MSVVKEVKMVRGQKNQGERILGKVKDQGEERDGKGGVGGEGHNTNKIVGL